MKKALVLSLALLIIGSVLIPQTARAEITPKTMMRVEAGVCATIGALLATNALTWASHTKTVWNIDTSKDNKTNKAVHEFMLLGTSFVSIGSAIASYQAFKTAYNLFCLQTIFSK